jgi:hypothetical protein
LPGNGRIFKNYKLQATNYKQKPNYNVQNYKQPYRAFKSVRRTPDVCNLYFVICNFPDKPVPFWFRLVRAVDRQKFGKFGRELMANDKYNGRESERGKN